MFQLLSSPKQEKNTPAALPRLSSAELNSLSASAGQEMHEGFKSVAAPLLQFLFAGANAAKFSQSTSQDFKSLQLPKVISSQSEEYFSVDRFRKDREILMAALSRNPVAPIKHLGEKKVRDNG